MLTTSVAVQAHSPINTSSIGPGALFRWRSESITMACPLLALPTKRSSSLQVTCASTIGALPRENSIIRRRRVASLAQRRLNQVQRIFDVVNESESFFAGKTDIIATSFF